MKNIALQKGRESRNLLNNLLIRSIGVKDSFYRGRDRGRSLSGAVPANFRSIFPGTIIESQVEVGAVGVVIVVPKDVEMRQSESDSIG